MEWEKVCSGTYRMRIPGGWMVKQYAAGWKESSNTDDKAVAVALCVVPDPKNKWVLPNQPQVSVPF